MRRSMEKRSFHEKGDYRHRGAGACRLCDDRLSGQVTMAWVYYDRGISHLQMKDYEKAIVEFQRSINTDRKVQYVIMPWHDL